MRLLVDTCVAGSVVHALRLKGFDVQFVVEWERDPGDRAILKHAYDCGQVLLTRDKDFGELIFRDNQPHNGLLRLAGEITYAEQTELALRVLAEHAADLERGCIVTVEANGRVRVSEGMAKH